MADRNAAESVRSLHQWGMGTRSDPTTPDGGNDGESGRADLMAYLNGQTVAIEVKRGKTSFNIFSWRWNQRLWARRDCIGTFNVDYWIMLAIGPHPPHYNASKYMPRRAWLIPYNAYRRLENFFLVAQLAAFSRGEISASSVQYSIPYRAGRGYSKFLQEIRLDAVHLFEPYALEWRKGSDGRPGYWHCPETHVFHRTYLLPQKGLVVKETDTLSELSGRYAWSL